MMNDFEVGVRAGAWSAKRRAVLASWALAAGALMGLSLPAAAQAPSSAAGPRLALVIGNGDYLELPKLEAAASDADLVAQALTARGFKVVKATNVKREVMTALLNDFEQSLATQGGVGVFYFSGQAIQVAGEDVMFPVDARVARGTDILKEGINLAQIQQAIKSRTSRPWRDNGIVTVYAASKGQPAFDRLPGKQYSPFSTALANALSQSNDEVQDVFNRVRQSVEETFRDPSLKGLTQTPDISGQLREKLFFSRPDRDPVGTISRVLFIDASRDNPFAAPLSR
jgi:hypothetical protein